MNGSRTLSERLPCEAGPGRPGLRKTRFPFGIGILAGLLLWATPAHGQSGEQGGEGRAGAEPPGSEVAEGAEPAGNDRVAQRPDRRVYAGMWTFHFRWQESGIKRNPVLALSWNGVFVGTFVNTYEVRTFTAGYQEELLEVEVSGVRLGLGYRAGLMTGYDERLHPLADRSPVFPLVQGRLNADTRWGGFEVTYAGIIATGAVYLRF